MTLETYTVESALALDLMLWRRFRRATPGLVERVLDLNPGLAALGPEIPAGTTVTIPIDPPPAQTVRPLVRLWD